MTREEAIKYLEVWRECYRNSIDSCTAQAIGMAIEALEAQDRPIICPRCGRTFAESEGRE